MAEKQLPIRLFVGGLPANVTAQQLAGRFASFGTLAALDLVPDKLDSGTARCRGFAYIDFLPQNDQALHRCISLYNGCKWLGGVLRVEKAREHYLSKLQKEWHSEPAQEIEMAEIELPAASEEAMRIPTPASGFVKRKLMSVQPNPVKRIFAPTKGQHLRGLSWHPPPDPPSVRKRRAAEQAAAEYASKRQASALQSEPPSEAQTHGGTSQTAGQTAEQHAAQDELQHQHLQQQNTVKAQPEATEGEELRPAQAASAPSESSASSEAGVVDFMSEGEMDVDEAARGTAVDHAGPHTRIEAGLSRFGSDSDDEQMMSQDPAQAYAETHTPTQAGMSRFDSNRDATQGTQATAPAAGAAHTGPDSIKALSRFDSSTDGSMDYQTAATIPATDAHSGGQTATEAVPAPMQAGLDRDSNDSPDMLPVPNQPGTATGSSRSDSGSEGDSGNKHDEAKLIAQLQHRDQLTGQGAPAIASSAAASSASEVESSSMEDASRAESSDEDVAAEGQSSPVDDADLADLSNDISLGAQSASQNSELDQPTCRTEDHNQDFSQDQDRGNDRQPDHEHHVVQTQALHAERLGHGDTVSQESQCSSQHAPSRSNGSDAHQDGDHADAHGKEEEVSMDRAAEQDDVTATAVDVDSRHEAMPPPLYSDVKVLRHGSSFWRQQKTVSTKAWEAQRTALQKDYREKRRAATKHLQRKRKTSRS